MWIIINSILAINLIYIFFNPESVHFDENYVYALWILTIQIFKNVVYYTAFVIFLKSLAMVTIFVSVIIYVAIHENLAKWQKVEFNRDRVYRHLAWAFGIHGKVMHDHEIVGLENIPATGGAILVYFHATATPLDYVYVLSKAYTCRGRHIRTVADRVFFLLPGFRYLAWFFKGTIGTMDECLQLLNEGHVLAIAPGGAREALFAGNSYEMIWGKRIGFAKAAVLAKQVLRWLFEKYTIQVEWVTGVWPVKMVTYIGEPIYFKEGRTAEELRDLTKKLIEEMRDKYQRIPGSVFHGILDRFEKNKVD